MKLLEIGTRAQKNSEGKTSTLTCVSNNVIKNDKFLKEKYEFAHGFLRRRLNLKRSKIKFGIFVALHKKLKGTDLRKNQIGKSRTMPDSRG